MEKTLEEKAALVAKLRPIDDAFFEVLADDPAVCQEMLRTILADEDLVVIDVIVQSSERNLYGRSVRLDALCRLGNGKRCNIEVQRSDDDDHFRRVRFNAASITVRESQTGTKFAEIPDLIVVYISQFDIFKGGRSLYHVDKIVRETGGVVDDGLTELFANTEVKDGTKVSRLMGNFLKTEINDPEFPVISSRVHFLKNDEKGVAAVCDVVEEYAREQNEKIQAELKKTKAERDRMAAERDQSNAERDRMAAERDQSNAERDRIAAERDQSNAERDRTTAENEALRRELAALKASIEKKNRG